MIAATVIVIHVAQLSWHNVKNRNSNFMVLLLQKSFKLLAIFLARGF